MAFRFRVASLCCRRAAKHSVNIRVYMYARTTPTRPTRRVDNGNIMRSSSIVGLCVFTPVPLHSYRRRSLTRKIVFDPGHKGENKNQRAPAMQSDSGQKGDCRRRCTHEVPGKKKKNVRRLGANTKTADGEKNRRKVTKIIILFFTRSVVSFFFGEYLTRRFVNVEIISGTVPSDTNELQLRVSLIEIIRDVK